MTISAVPGTHPDAPVPGPRHPPVLRLGFRPFYLLGMIAGVVLPPVWLAILRGARIEPVLPAAAWHGHEMLYGVVVAMVAGFLLTAGRVWTGLATPTGPALGALALLWLAGRITGLTGPHVVFVLCDAAFLPVVAFVFARLIVRSGNVRNLPVAVLLSLLALANLLFHGAAAGVVPLPPEALLRATIALLVLIQTIIGGRVIPAFTAAAVPGSRPRAIGLVERVLLPVAASALLAWLALPHNRMTASLLALVSVMHVVRLAGWQPWVTRRNPILWILPAAYAWLPVGFALLALSAAGWIGESAGVHALTAGAMGCMIVAMVTRTARGHTGRPLRAGPAEIAAYALVLAGAACRVAAGLVDPAHWGTLLALATLLWSGAYALILVNVGPWLVRGRIDGKEG